MNYNEHQDHQHIIEKLNRMPKVKDKREQSEVFQSISSQLNKKDKKPVKTKKLVPIFGTILAVGLLFIMFPSLYNTKMFQTSEEQYSESIQENAVMDRNMENNERSTNNLQQQEESAENEETEQEIRIMNTDSESYVVQEVDSSSTIVHGAVSDSQQQYVIPISLIVPKSNDINSYYNNLEKYLNKIIERGYLFENVSFNVDKVNNEVIMDLPEDYSLGEGSARANMFENMLAVMFSPYNIEKVIFKESVNLGPFGNVQELTIKQENKSSYKLYEVAETKMLIQIPNEERVTINEAINEMKNSDGSFHVSQTIPDNIHFSTESSDNHLILTFAEDTVLTNNQNIITMIDAILMTAKSYGYDFVSFENPSIEQIGPYILTKPIPVPEGVNPIYQNN